MKNWFKGISWKDVVHINRTFCIKGSVQHGISESQSPQQKRLLGGESRETNDLLGDATTL